MFSLVEAMTLAGIDLSDWEGWSVHDLSADGNTIVGRARHNGVDEAWRVQLIPEPTTALLLGFGLGVLAMRRSLRSD